MRAYFIETRNTLFETMMMNFDELPQFEKEFKKLAKKYKSLPKDLQQFKQIVSVVPLGNSKHFHVITQTNNVKIVKARFFCQYLKGTSLRLIYAYFEKEQKIEFIEICFKGDKENEDRKRIVDYVHGQSNKTRVK